MDVFFLYVNFMYCLTDKNKDLTPVHSGPFVKFVLTSRKLLITTSGSR